MSEVKSLRDYDRWYDDMPNAHIHSTLATVDADPANLGAEVFDDYASRIIESWDGEFAGLYLYGTPGTGKTHRAIGLARALLDRSEDKAVSSTHLPIRANLPANRYAAQVVAEKHEFWGARGVNFRSTMSLPNRNSGRPMRSDDKIVYLLDEYRPAHTQALLACLEVADQNGGLVIITSNFEDPFLMFEAVKRAKNAKQIIEEDYAARIDSGAIDELNRVEAEQAEHASESLRSRVVNNFRFVDLSGPDNRVKHNFWAN